VRIHTDGTITDSEFWQAAREAGVAIEVMSKHGSRKRWKGYEIQLSGSSRYSAQSGQWKAATWDEWGVFLAFLFDREPGLIAGSYDGRDDFINQTADAIEREKNYERIVGRKRPGITAPWLNDLRAA
jgi:hypothetical protein